MTLENLMQQFQQLQADVQTLKDIEEIRQTKFAYFRGIDTADLPLLGSLMHPDVTVHFVGGGYEWTLTGRDEYVAAIGKNFNSRVVAQHNGHHPEIKITSPSSAEGIWYLYDNFYNLHTRDYTRGTALYKDTYEKVDGKWLIKSTSYHRVYEIVDPIEQDLNLTVHYLAKHGQKID